MTDTSTTDRQALLDRYASGAADVADAVAGASDADLDRRPPSGAWTAREIVHHVAKKVGR